MRYQDLHWVRMGQLFPQPPTPKLLSKWSDPMPCAKSVALDWELPLMASNGLCRQIIYQSFMYRLGPGILKYLGIANMDLGVTRDENFLFHDVESVIFALTELVSFMSADHPPAGNFSRSKNFSGTNCKRDQTYIFLLNLRKVIAKEKGTFSEDSTLKSDLLEHLPQSDILKRFGFDESLQNLKNSLSLPITEFEQVLSKLIIKIESLAQRKRTFEQNASYEYDGTLRLFFSDSLLIDEMPGEPVTEDNSSKVKHVDLQDLIAALLEDSAALKISKKEKRDMQKFFRDQRNKYALYPLKGYRKR